MHRKTLNIEWYKDAINFVRGIISSGKTTFLTKFGCDTIIRGAVFIVSAITLNRLNPRNNANAKSKKFSFFNTPNFP